jgi:flagellar hook-length control protein FliK
MNKSVLPISLDSVSLAKPQVKKPVLAELDKSTQADSFAERLSQSQREMAKDKLADRVTNKARDKAEMEKSTARVRAEDNQPQKKPHPKKDQNTEVNRAEKNLHADTKVKTQSTKSASEKSESAESIKDLADAEDSTRESSIDTPITPVDPTSVLNPLEQTGSEIVQAETDITLETELLAVASVPVESPLAETNDELIMKGVDAKTFTENYLKGIDTKSIAEVNESAAIVNDMTALAEMVEASNSVADAVKDQLANAPAAIIAEPRLTVPASIVSSPVSENEANKNGMDLPPELMVGELEEVDSSLDGTSELMGEMKSEDKSTKADLFKSLLAQSQNEKSSVTEKPVQASPLVTATAAQTTTQLATANRLFVPQTQLGMNVAHPNWGNGVGEKIMWMANQQLSSADIRLDPPELGSLQVRVSVQQDQANITFISPHPQVRELLDQQVTRLREMFAEQGLQLGQVDIADRREHESRQSDDEPKSKGRFVSEEPEDTQIAAVSSLYLVDQFV